MRPRYSPMPRKESTPPLSNICSVKPISEIPINATAQQKAASEIKMAKKKLTESE